MPYLRYTLRLKKEPSLTSCSFVKRGLFVIVVGKQYQHAFKNYMPIQLSLSLHFCLYFFCF